MKKLNMYTVLFLLVGTTAFAGNSYQIRSKAPMTEAATDSRFYQLKAAKIQEVVPTAEEIYGFTAEQAEQAEVKAPATFLEDIDINKIILIGEKVIELIKRGAPVVNIKRDVVYAIPKGLEWQQLTGWQLPVTKVYQVQIVNGLNMNVVDARVKVSSMYGGSYMGKGQYLANVVVVPTSVKVLWGFSLDLWTENREPINMGQVEAPIAGLGFDIRYKVTSWATEINGTQDYFVLGSGDIKQIQ